MTRSPLRRKIVTLFLATALLASWVSAAEPSDHSSQGSLAQIWSFLTGITLDAGCWLDPNGHCAAGTVVPDAGCSPDPDGGRCATGAKVTPDAGCMVDPDGRCVR